MFSFQSVVITKEPTDSSGNQAEIRNVTVSNGTDYKVHMVFTNAGVGEYWIGRTCGLSGTKEEQYNFIDYTKTNKSIDKLNINDGYSNGYFISDLSKKGYSYSFYLKGGVIYIVNDANEKDAGYIYIASNVSQNGIRVTTTNSLGENPLSGATISGITGEETSNGLIYNNEYTYLHRIPMYNLRGMATSSHIVSMVVTDGTLTTEYTWDAPTTGSPNIFIALGSSTQDSTVKGPTASLAFMIDKYINASKDCSVCSMEKSKAQEIVTEYKKVLITQERTTDFSKYNLYTWSGVDMKDKKEWQIDIVYAQILMVSVTGPLRSESSRNFMLFGEENNNASVIIVVVTASSLLLISSLCLCLFLKKKKEN